TGAKSMAPFQMGFLHATPVSGAGYNGNADVDWWYTTDTTSVDGNRNPKTSLMNGKFTAGGNLSSDAGTINLDLVLAGSTAELTMKNTVLTAVSGMVTAPGTSTGGTPGHLSSENILTGLKTFQTLSGGKICGDITAGSLYAVKLPMSFDGQCN